MLCPSLPSASHFPFRCPDIRSEPWHRGRATASSVRTAPLLLWKPGVTIAATQSQTPEAGSPAGEFTVSLQGVSNAPLTVNYAVSGTAKSGSDYPPLSGQVTIPLGSSSARIAVTPKQDAEYEGNETVIVTLAATDPFQSPYVVGSPNSATVTILDDDTLVTISQLLNTSGDVAAYSALPESAKGNLIFRVTRQGPTTAPLTVNYTVSGSATRGSDYTLPISVTIPANATTATIPLTLIDDTQAEEDETVEVQLSNSSQYTVGSPGTSKFTILDNDTVVTIKAGKESLREASSNEFELCQICFKVTRAGSTAKPLRVECSLGGTATNGSDYHQLPSFIEIPAGSTEAAFGLTPPMDNLPEGDESVVLTLLPNNRYTLGSPSSATIVIKDFVLPTVSISATDATAAEQGQDTGTLTITRTGETSQPLTVNYQVNPTGGIIVGSPASNGSDFNQLSGAITIPAGSAAATLTITPIDDALPEGSESVVIKLAPSALYNLGSSSSATVTISDNDQSTVTISATDPNASEAGPDPGAFTITRTSPTTAALTVYLSGGLLVVGGGSNQGVASGSDYVALPSSVTIPAGSASATITVTPIDDALVESDETVTVSLSAIVNGSYLVGTPSTATITIKDNDLPTVTISATDALAQEITRDPAVFTVSRTGPTTTALTVNYAVSGTATNGQDYEFLSGTLVIAAGQSSATITVKPIIDNLAEGAQPETVIITLSSSTAYTLGTTKTATANIYESL